MFFPQGSVFDIFGELFDFRLAVVRGHASILDQRFPLTGLDFLRLLLSLIHRLLIMDDFPFNVALEELKCLTCVIQVLTCGQVDCGERRSLVAHSLLQVMVDVRLRDGRVIDHVLEVIRRLLNNAQVPRALRRHQVTDLPLMVRILLRSLRIASGLGRVAPEALLLLKAGQELLLEGSALVGWRQERQDSAW